MSLNFGRTLHALSNDGDVFNHGDCFFYGSVAGCDDGCPQLRRGACENADENRALIESDEDLKKMYKF